MPIPLSTADQVFARLWRPGHPFRNRCSRKRQWGMGILLVILIAIIITYAVLTNPRRVRALSQEYLTRLVGAPVQIDKASLSVFEGLRLRGVRVYVDRVSPEDLIFSADNIDLQYKPQSLLRGKIQATQLTATSPIVRLVEDAKSGKWNYMRLGRMRPKPPAPQTGPPTSQQAPAPPSQPELLPEIRLRDAQVEYSELREGRTMVIGRVSIEGHLWPEIGAAKCLFELQTRGQHEGIGPRASGAIDLESGAAQAELHNLQFGRDVSAMLPVQVRNWWIEHKVIGKIDFPELQFSPLSGKSTFRIMAKCQGIGLTLDPRQWLSPRQSSAARQLLELSTFLEASAPFTQQLVDPLSRMFEINPISLQRADGSIIFTQDGVEIPELIAQVGDNRLHIAGKIDGYALDAPIDVTLATLPDQPLVIASSQYYVNSMPAQVREIYNLLRPSGVFTGRLSLRRTAGATRPEVTAEVIVQDGNMTYANFPYPIRSATGKLVLGVEPDSRIDKLDIIGMTGKGQLGGPNENSTATINGWVGPFDERVGTDITIVGKNFTCEPPLRAAFPAETRKVLAMFDPDGKGLLPEFSGDFVCHAVCPIGVHTITSIVTEINLADARGAMAAFPYPLRGVHGTLIVGDDKLQLRNMQMTHGAMNVSVEGVVATQSIDGRTRFDPNVSVDVKNLAIDSDLLSALPQKHRQWLEKLGLRGAIDLSGKIIPGKEPGRSEVDLQALVRDGSMLPTDNKPMITDLSAGVHVLTQSLQLEHLSARRGEGMINASGRVDWSGPATNIELSGSARSILLDEPLCRALPADVRGWIEQINPVGSVHLEGSYKSNDQQVLSLLKIIPEKLSIKPVKIPLLWTDVSGELLISQAGISLQNTAARHGDATLKVTGGNTSGAWELGVLLENLSLDDELRRALPQNVQNVLTTADFSGHVNIDAPKILYRSPTTQRSSELQLAARVQSADLSSAGTIRLGEVKGYCDLALIARGGKLDSLAGKLQLDSLRLSDREVKNLRAQVSKATSVDVVRIEKLSAEIGDGELAGNMDLVYGEGKRGSYAMNLVLRNADVRDIARLGKDDIQGQLTASLSLEGVWSDPSSRRGRGDAIVSGKQLYYMPVLLGVMEITNLAIPISSPFSEGTARYIVEGQRLTFESVELKSANMIMTGSGYLDFAKKIVRMSFATDNPNWPKVPFVSELVQNARKELLQIQVRGTIQEPKVSTSPMNTFTTTVDEVLKGADNSK